MSLKNIVDARLCTKHPFRTYWLEVDFYGTFPVKDFSHILPEGWKSWKGDTPEGPEGSGIPATREFSKPGTDIFHGWTEKEAERNLKEIEGAFMVRGVRLKKWRLTMRDLL